MSVLKCLSWTTRLDRILAKVQPGDLVRFHRGLFIHHAVFVGHGRAVHHHLGPSDGEVIEATMEYLAKGDLMKVFKLADMATPFSPREIVTRARSQIGPRPYSLHDGNCEHFTTWVYHDVRASSQLDGLCEYELSLLRIVRHERRSGAPPSQQQSSQKQSSQQQSSHQQSSQKRSLQQQTSQQQQSSQQESSQLDSLQQESSQIQSSKQQTSQQKQPRTLLSIDDSDSDTTDESFVFVPPRPIKYRHTQNPVRIACNHTRSCLKVLAVQSIVGLAAVPLYRCSMQADNLQKLGRQLTLWRRRPRKLYEQQQQQPQQQQQKQQQQLQEELQQSSLKGPLCMESSSNNNNNINSSDKNTKNTNKNNN